MQKELNWLDMQSIEAWDGNNKIFEDLSLKLNFADNTILLGPNGSGKTSIISLINRSIYPIVKPNSYFKLFGSEAINIWDVRKRVGFLLTEIENRIYNQATVIDVIKTGLYNTYRIGNGQFKSLPNDFFKLEQTLDILELSEIKDNTFKILSDGQKRRALIGRALINNPEILILDEPTAKLDIKSKYILLRCLERLWEGGTTLLQITHDISTISDSANRIICIRNGKITEDGTPNDVLTSKNLSNLFDINLKISFKDNLWNAHPV